MNDFDSGKPEEQGFSVNPAAVPAGQDKPEPPQKTTFAADLIDWLDILTVSVIAVVILFTFLFRVATIEGTSMLDTLHDKERVIITNMNYTPKYKDIVVISRNVHNSVADATESDKPIIKRVIATGGQTVDIDFATGEVKVDGAVLEEKYISTPTTDQYEVQFPVYVPKGYVFVLGDNRGNSRDSRSATIGENGLIDERYILGHAVFRIFPFDSIGSLTKK